MNLYNELKLLGKLCFDVGANLGNKTSKFLSFGASVVSIEPQSSCFSILKSKFSENQNVHLVNTALGCEEGVKSMFISEHHTLSTLSVDFMNEVTKHRFKNNIWGKTEEVSITTLDKLIELYGLPKFCKIDCEGYEIEILKGLTKPLEYISLEFVPELKHKTFECIEVINKLGNYKFNYVEGESDSFLFDNWLSDLEIIEYLKTKNDFVFSFGDLYAKLV